MNVGKIREHLAFYGKICYNDAVASSFLEANMNNITGAIFDMDGTLTDSMFVWDECMDEVLHRYFHTTRDQMDQAMVQKMDTAPISIGGPMLCEYFSSSIDPNEILGMMREYFRDFYCNKIELKDGVRELLDHLKKKGVRMCVASASSPEMVRAALKHCEIEDCFCAVLTCDDVKKSKEYPDIYEAALSLLNTPKETTWIFEDAVIALRTAHRMGMNTVGIYDAGQKEQEEIRSLSMIYVEREENHRKLIACF